LLKDHIQKVVGRYRGRIRDWDVVNEAVDDEQKDGMRRDSFWYRTIGPDYIALAFKTAHEVDPDALLYYNDFSNEGKGKKSDLVYKLLQDLKRQGVPIDGIGWQMHLPAGFKMKPEHRENAQRLVELGLELAITELDVRVKMPPTPDALTRQAETYRDVANFCLTQPRCGALITWGFTDKHSWVPSVFPGEGNALLFDENLQAKAAYASLRDALANAVNGAPRINEARISDGALKLRGDNFEKGSMIFADGISLRPSAVQSGEMIFKDFQRVSSGRKTMILQIQAKGGKLSAPRNLAVETGTLTELK
jgi:endo-1,4-beta-xylanase